MSPPSRSSSRQSDSPLVSDASNSNPHRQLSTSTVYNQPSSPKHNNPTLFESPSARSELRLQTFRRPPPLLRRQISEMETFSRSVEDGLALTKRLEHGPGDAPVSRQKMEADLSKGYFPTAPMVYAVIRDPAIVDNPDVPSYQPYVYGKHDPPALIPVNVMGVELDVDCVVADAVVEFSGSFRVHCVANNKQCDCCLVVPLGEKCTLLGADIQVSGRTFSTKLASAEDTELSLEEIKGDDDLKFVKRQLLSVTIPQVNGGETLLIKIRWIQKLLYVNGHFSLTVPFIFPDYVKPYVDSLKKEKIQLNVDVGVEKELTYSTISHAMKRVGHQKGKLQLLYQADVIRWSTSDFNFSYGVSATDAFGGVLTQSPSEHDFDRRDTFYLYLFPGNTQLGKFFRKEVIFVMDMSESMQGRPLEDVKHTLSEALSKLTPTDAFNIIAFNDDTHIFSSSLELATIEKIDMARQWLNSKCVASGGTNILLPLTEAMRMLSNAHACFSQIFLITDGSVEDERSIVHFVQDQLKSKGSKSINPRISTFGIGTYCNHYFLRLLASIGRGNYDAAYNTDFIDSRLQKLFGASSSPVITNIKIDTYLDDLEAFPSLSPDLSLSCPIVISGRCSGKLPGSLKVIGSVVDGTDFAIDLSVHNLKGNLLSKVIAKQEIDMLTAQAWLSQSRQLEDKVVKISKESSIPSEYSRMVLVQTNYDKDVLPPRGKRKIVQNKNTKLNLVHGLSFGFGDVHATASNMPVELIEPQTPQGFLATRGLGCCSFCAFCTCSCCRDMSSTTSRALNGCSIVCLQLISALACCACFECCADVCCGSPE